MKTILEFNLPEEQDELDWALKGGIYKCQLDAFNYWIMRVLRGKESLTPEHKLELSEVEVKTLEAVQEQLFKITREE